jgi:branched-chain amino acid transport system permease protein
MNLKRNWPIMTLIVAILIGMAAPLALGMSAPGFYIEVLLGGLMAGVLYSLVALGFVLIFKASGVFNFAQGAMVLFAALAMARLAEWIPALLGIESRLLGNLIAFSLAVAIMIGFAWLVERMVLRHLVNQEGVVLLMATLGITYFIDGVGQTVWGSDIYEINLGLPKTPTLIADGLFVQKTATGRALRAVADDHQAAQSIGIPLNTIWVIVWAVAGIVALVAGMIWGSKLGVQFSIALVALKALPVVILGGLTSVPGAIIGGLIIGVGEKFAEVFLSPVLVQAFDLAGGGIENWFAYVLALAFLLVRPEGLFGEKIIDRV